MRCARSRWYGCVSGGGGGVPLCTMNPINNATHPVLGRYADATCDGHCAPGGNYGCVAGQCTLYLTPAANNQSLEVSDS